MENLKFKEMNLSDEIVRAIEAMGFTEPTPIQAQAIGVILENKDVLGQSQTGSGKTAAFGIPCLDRVDTTNKNVQVLVLCPTRELAIQISNEFQKLLKFKQNIKCIPIYGGQSIENQIFALRKGVQVVIGTPGRIMDHMNRRTLKIDSLKTVILDEADEMLDMGFKEDIEKILMTTPKERQTILFSATMPKGILSLTRSFQTNPQHVKVANKQITVNTIKQNYFDVKERTKFEALSRVLDMDNPKLGLIFCNTKRKVDEVVESLQSRGYFAEALHGDLKQHQRDFVMKKFRNGTIQFLVATDVAARGIDVENVDLVFNYDLPQDSEYYVHRIGRTGRAGRSGTAYTFVVGSEIFKLREIMNYTKANIERQNLPSINDVQAIKSQKFTDKIKNIINEGNLDKYKTIAEGILSEGISDIDLSAALLKIHLHDALSMNIELESPNRNEYRNNNNGSNKYKQTRKDYDNKNMSRLFINMGKTKNLRASDLVRTVASESKIAGSTLGAISIYNDFSFIDVPKEQADHVINSMKNKNINGFKFNIEKSRPRRES